MTSYEGKLNGAGLRVALVCGRFNDLITTRLVAGARDGLVRHGVDPSSISEAWVPGAFELPLVARRLAGSGEFDAIVCLGQFLEERFIIFKETFANDCFCQRRQARK